MSFAESVTEFSKKTEKKIRQGHQLAIISLFSSVILRSPVDTGRFRANWIITADQPSKDTRMEFDKSGSYVINTVVKFMEDNKASTIYLANNLPYAERLENGWSQQAPYGMVRLSIASFDRMFKEAVDKS